MKVLLVEPAYYTKFPPLGLLKLASYHRSRGNQVKLVRDTQEDLNFNPDRIEITSLFTYAWKPVHEAIRFYHGKFHSARMRVGGIYASLMPRRLRSFFPFVNVNVGLCKEADGYLPAYDLLKEVKEWERWDSTILFTSRGCIRNCPYCIVPKLEGKIHGVVEDLKRYVYPDHKRIILWDNNFFAMPNWKKILNELLDIGLPVDWNQGIDSRLVDGEKARMIASLRTPVIRTAFDDIGEKKALTNAVESLSKSGIRRRKIFVYTLYNFYNKKYPSDTPATFFERIRHVADLGCVSYPMRYEPLKSLEKNCFASPLWNDYQLKMIGRARRILGYGGAFPPYVGLVKKFKRAHSFEEAFSVFPLKNKTQALEIKENTEMIPQYALRQQLLEWKKQIKANTEKNAGKS
jgi:hypothetical protein